MALQWADTFNTYGTNSAFMLNGLYANNTGMTLVADPDPTSTANVARIPIANISRDFRFVYLTGATATIGCAIRLWMSSLPQDDNTYSVVYWSDISNTVQVTLRIRSTGQITVYRGDPTGAGVALGTTTLPVIAANAWNHIETKLTVNSSTGAVEVRVNGASVLTLTGQNTQVTGVASTAQMSFFNFSGTANNGNIMYLKDFVIWDTTGSFNNTFMGTVQCLDTLTDGDTLLTWVPNSGTTGFNILATTPPLDDASYIAAATTLTSTFTLANLPSTVSSVRGNVIKTRARKIDSGDGNIQVGLKSGASTSLGANRAITTAYTYWVDVNETDPATGAQWTLAAFNSAGFQLARTV